MTTQPIRKILFSGLVLGAVLVMSAGADDKKEPQSVGSIERLNPKLDQLIPKDAKIEQLAEDRKSTRLNSSH